MCILDLDLVALGNLCDWGFLVTLGDCHHCGGINPYTLMGRYGPHHQKWLGPQDEDVRRMTLVGVHRKATRYCTK